MHGPFPVIIIGASIAAVIVMAGLPERRGKRFRFGVSLQRRIYQDIDLLFQRRQLLLNFIEQPGRILSGPRITRRCLFVPNVLFHFSPFLYKKYSDIL